MCVYGDGTDLDRNKQPLLKENVLVLIEKTHKTTIIKSAGKQF